MVVAFPKILKTLLVSVLTGRKIYILESLSAFLVWIFPSVSLYFAPFNSQAVTGLTMFLLTLTIVFQHWVNQTVDQTTSFLFKLLWF